MNRLLRYPLVHLLGLPGLAGLVLGALCLALYVFLLHPAQLHLADLGRQVAAARGQVANVGREAPAPVETAAAQLANFYQVFPDQQATADVIGQIAGIVRRHGLSLDQGEYKVMPDPLGKLNRVRMVMPLKGSYQQIRACIEALYSELPIVALEQVQFERQTIGDPTLDARLRLVLFLGREAS
jgi:hypothetical protein